MFIEGLNEAPSHRQSQHIIEGLLKRPVSLCCLPNPYVSGKLERRSPNTKQVTNFLIKHRQLRPNRSTKLGSERHLQSIYAF
jgi:hypothetical protein